MQQKQLTGSSTTTTASSNTGTSRKQEIKRQERKFLMFARVLIKILEQNDTRMHAQAKTVIEDCDKRHKRQEPGYENGVMESMPHRLKELLVGDRY